MGKPTPKDTVRILLKRHPKTFAEELGIDVEANTPEALFCRLVVALLSGARIGHTTALKSARLLIERGWTTPEKMAATTWEQRVRVLDEGGYVREVDELVPGVLDPDIVEHHVVDQGGVAVVNADRRPALDADDVDILEAHLLRLARAHLETDFDAVAAGHVPEHGVPDGDVALIYVTTNAHRPCSARPHECSSISTRVIFETSARRPAETPPRKES